MREAPAVESDLYIKVLKLQPELWQVAQIAVRARESVQYPVRRFEDLLVLSDDRGRGTLKLDTVRLTLAQVKRYFPSSLFPIGDEDDFIRKVLVGLLWGKKVHALEAEANHRRSKRPRLLDLTFGRKGGRRA